MALLSHWRKHPVQLASVLAGLWLATALLIAVQALNGQARASYAQASELIGGKAQASLAPVQGQRMPQALFVQLRRQGWPVSPLLQGSVTVNGQRLQVNGIDPLSLPAHTALGGQAPSQDDLYAFIGDPGQAWVSTQTLASLGLSDGARPTPGMPPLYGRRDMAPGVLLMDIGHAQDLLQAPEQLSRLLVAAGFSAELPATFNGQLRWQHTDPGQDMQRLTEALHLNLAALGLLAFVVGLFIAQAAIGLALEQRRGLLRTLRACGVGLRVLIIALTLELTLLALVGAVAGVFSGYLLASLLLPDVAASLRGLYGAEVGNQLSLGPWWWLGAIGLSLAGALLAGGQSLWRAARLPLLALAGHQAWRGAHGQWLQRQGWAALVLATLAVALVLWGDSLAAGFTLLACLLLAAALALPVMLDRVLAVLASGRRGAVLSHWFLADCRQQLPALSQALMALLLAMATNVGASSMTQGFRETFSHWLEQRLVAELYVRPNDGAQTAQVQTWLQQRGEVRRVLPGREQDVSLQGWPVEVHGVVDDALYRQHWPLLEAATGNPWDRLFDSDSLMLSEQLARHLHIGLGEPLSLPGQLASKPFTVVGIYADYGNPKGHVLISASTWQHLWPGQPPTRLAVRVAPYAVPGLKAALQAKFALDDSRLVDQGQLKRWAVQVFERTFSATSALDSLTLAVAAVALFISLLTQSDNRLGHLAPLWALGVNRRQLIALNLAQTWLLSLLTLVLALPLGILLAWCLVAVVNVQAFGWRLPLQVFPGQILQLLGWAMLATALASAWPLVRLLRSRPADLLRVFADER
ncbi:ABC transporter permease [Pseudomonas sp.]|uniref:ABC transporter permease n=1 Tax=Pseudomonas sp. TaxID=306 RepID=UPI003CC5DA95